MRILAKQMLDIQNYSCGYGSEFSLSGIDFTLAEGCFAGIIGPNGSGKTTLFRGISSELSTRKGSIIINDKNLYDLSFNERAKNIAVVSQNIETAHIKLDDYVLMGRLPYQSRFTFFETKRDIKIAEKYMRLTNVWHLKDKLMAEMSGGEQQLAAIARALTQEPKLLLLDEPTAHLDISHQVQVLNLIQELNKNLKLTVLMNIHDLNLAGEYCDYLIMLKEGKVHTKGTPEEVLNYKHIEDVYNTVVVTDKNPVSNKPTVFLVSGRVMDETKSKN